MVDLEAPGVIAPGDPAVGVAFDSFAVGGSVFAAMGDDREAELPGGFDVGVGATQLQEPVGVAMLE